MSHRTILPRQTIQTNVSDRSSRGEDEKRDPSPTSSTTSRKRGPLVTAACNACRKRKVRCDGHKPNCSNCSKRSIPCTYDETSKTERIRLLLDKHQEAHDKIDALATRIDRLARSDSRNSTHSEALAQATEEADLMKSTLLQLGTEIPSRPSYSSSQPTFIDDAFDNVDGESSVQDLGQNLPSSFSTSEGRHITIIIPTSSLLTGINSPTSQLNSRPFGQSFTGEQQVRIHQEDSNIDLYTPLYHMLPLNLSEHEEISKPCILQCLRCRGALADGMSVEDVLGSESLDFTILITPNTSMFVHPFTRWIVSYINALAASDEVEWSIKLASVYCMFHLSRWLILPTRENYDRVPDFLKPTPLQLFVAHSSWIDFVFSPGMRNEYILHPRAEHVRQWRHALNHARIIWPNNDVSSTVTLDNVTNAIQIDLDFESTIRNIENWFLPY